MDGFEVIGLRFDLVVLACVTFGSAILAALLFVVWWVARKTGTGYDPGWGWGAAAVAAVIAGVASGAAFVAMLIPFQSLYHHWYSTSGVVVSVTNIFEGGSGELSPGYVVELDSLDEPLVFTDPRILRTVGEEVNVACSVEWVPSGVDRLNCWIAK